MQHHLRLVSVLGLTLTAACRGDVADPGTPTRLEILPSADTVTLALPGGVRIGARLLNARGEELAAPATPSWQVLDTAVATIAADGTITPRRAGATGVIARMTHGGRTLADSLGIRVVPLR